MKIQLLILVMISFGFAENLFAQLPKTKTIGAILRTVEPGMNLVPAKGKYDKLSDSLDANLKLHPSDTTSLFYSALLLYSYNQKLAEPYQRTKGTLENLTQAKDLIEKAINNNMKDFRALLLRAQIYSELSFRFTGDESWMFSMVQISARRKLFNIYKEKSNQYYQELGKLDPANGYEYSKKAIKGNYPIK